MYSLLYKSVYVGKSIDMKLYGMTRTMHAYADWKSNDLYTACYAHWKSNDSYNACYAHWKSNTEAIRGFQGPGAEHLSVKSVIFI